MKVRLIVAGVIVVLIVALAFVTVSSKHRIDELQSQVAELNQKVTAYDGQPSIEDQGKCAKQADVFFKDNGFTLSDVEHFYGHYNLKMRKCFIVVRQTKPDHGQILDSSTLFDAFEGKIYGQYIWSSQKDKKYWEVPPIRCTVTTSDGAAKVCKSDGEFAQLASEYMDVSE